MTASKNIYTIWKKQACGTTPSWSSSATTAIACSAKSKIDDFAIPMIWPGGAIDTTFNQAKTTSRPTWCPPCWPSWLWCLRFTFGKTPCLPRGLSGPFCFLTMALVMWMQPMPWCFDNAGKRVIEQRVKSWTHGGEVAGGYSRRWWGDYLGGRGCGNSPTFSHLYPPCCRKAINVIIWESKYYFVIRRHKWGVAKHYIVKCHGKLYVYLVA